MDRDQSLISVVMPAYNAAKYIEESIVAILNQSLENFELIIVDDCSIDETWNIISNLSCKDRRIILKRASSNSGSAKYPREIAIQLAKSPFICWIDSDDIVESNYLERLLDRQKETNADIVCSQMIAFSEVNPCAYTLPRKGFDFTQCLNGKEAVMLTVGDQWQISVNGWLIKKELWLATSIFLDKEVLHMDADDYSSREMLLKARQVTFEKVSYFYRLHQEAITKKISHKLFESLITDSMVMKLFHENFPVDSRELRCVYKQYMMRIIALMRIYSLKSGQLSDMSRQIALKLLKENYHKCPGKEVLKSKLSISRKILLLLPFPLSLKIIGKLNS